MLLNFIFIFLFLVCDCRTVLERMHALDGMAVFAVFIGLYSLMALGLLAASFIRSHTVRISLAILFASASILQLSFEWTTAGPLTYSSFVNLSHATGQIGEAVAQHGFVLVKAIGAASLLFLGIALPQKRWRLPSRWAAPAPLLALGVLTLMLYVRGGEGSRGLPAAYPSIAYAGFMTVEQMEAGHGPREHPTLARTAPPQAQDIVLLVDESVAGNYLDLNQPGGMRSGLKEERKGVRVINFGYASSIHNCSANSNLVLRFGGTPQTYREAYSHWPSIWSYAHAAGLRTVYIDGQSDHGHLQNMMTPAERKEIDDFIQLDGVPVVERDMRIADLVAAHINNGRPEFIYVNKVGAHFPIADKYPEALTRYRPVMPRGHWSLASWSSDRTGFNGTPREWVLYRNSYRNTLLWNVGTFFDRLLSAADLRKAAIVYTSDHGQDLHERHNPGNNTHCGAGNAAQEEGLVPLAIIESDTVRGTGWERNLAANRDKSSGFRIFPTLLAMMGYDRAAMEARYGIALDGAGHDQFAYNVDFAPFLGKQPRFRKIDLKSVVAPPRSDYTSVPVK